jgi:hypothetical protein
MPVITKVAKTRIRATTRIRFDKDEVIRLLFAQVYPFDDVEDFTNKQVTISVDSKNVNLDYKDKKQQ